MWFCNANGMKSTQMMMIYLRGSPETLQMDNVWHIFQFKIPSRKKIGLSQFVWVKKEGTCRRNSWTFCYILLFWFCASKYGYLLKQSTKRVLTITWDKQKELTSRSINVSEKGFLDFWCLTNLIHVLKLP